MEAESKSGQDGPWKDVTGKYRDTDVVPVQAILFRGLKAVNEKLQEEVRSLAGEAPARQGTCAGARARRLGISYGPENTDRSAAGLE